MTSYSRFSTYTFKPKPYKAYDDTETRGRWLITTFTSYLSCLFMAYFPYFYLLPLVSLRGLLPRLEMERSCLCSSFQKSLTKVHYNQTRRATRAHAFTRSLACYHRDKFNSWSETNRHCSCRVSVSPILPKQWCHVVNHVTNAFTSDCQTMVPRNLWLKAFTRVMLSLRFVSFYSNSSLAPIRWFEVSIVYNLKS